MIDTADIDAPTLMGAMVPLFLYADDLILMSGSAAGLQKQLDALQAFANKRVKAAWAVSSQICFRVSNMFCLEVLSQGKVPHDSDPVRRVDEAEARIAA